MTADQIRGAIAALGDHEFEIVFCTLPPAAQAFVREALHRCLDQLVAEEGSA